MCLPVNCTPLTAEIDTLIQNLTTSRQAIEKGDRQELTDLLHRGRLIKAALGE